MNKKNLLFILSSFSHGGTNKSLQNMLSLMDKDKYEYYIFTTNKDDIYKEIFSKYNIIKCPPLLHIYSTSKSIFIRAIRFIDRQINFFFFKFLLKKFTSSIENKIDFDKIIAFEEGIHLRLIASAFKATKISWIHCDYKSYNEMFRTNLSKEYKLFSQFDKIICVSRTTKKSFINFFPILEHKTEHIYNILNSEEIKKDANKEIYDKKFIKDDFIIVSVGRLHSIKQFEKIPYIVNQIINKQKDIKFKWYIIGDGDSSVKNCITKEIEQYQLQDKVICLGSKNNPYPYIKKANLLVVTSLSEAYPCVINEAKILNTPVLSSNFDSAPEIVDTNLGIIAHLDEFPNILYNIINDVGMVYSKLKIKAEGYIFNNENILEKLYKLF